MDKVNNNKKKLLNTLTKQISSRGSSAGRAPG